jgi:hypothetical protein
MAHKGDRYPVHFRRDLSIDVLTYNAAFPWGWVGDIGFCTGLYFIATFATTLFLEPVDEKDRWPPFWQNELIVPLAGTVRWTFEFDDDWDAERPLGRMRWLLDGLQELAVATVVQPKRGGNRLVIAEMEMGSNPDELVLTCDPLVSRANLHFISWPQYNILRP